MPVSAKTVADYILASFQEVGDPITTAKLQKLLYYVQGWHLAEHGEPAFNGRIEAWMHGPTCPEIHDLYHGHWGRPIQEPVERPSGLEDRLIKLMDEIIELYGVDTGYSLHLRCREESPWLEARKGISNHQEGCREEVTQESMQRFFRAEAARTELA